MEKEFYAFCFLVKNKKLLSNWKIDTIHDHFPTEDEIINHTCLKDTLLDRKLAKKLIEEKGDNVKLVYSKDKSTWCEKFFEIMIITFEYGKQLNLDDYLITGYVDYNKDKIIFFEK